MSRKHIMFDLDGTLIDPVVGLCGAARHALATLNYPIPEQAVLEKFIGPPLNEAFPQLCGMPDEQVPKAIEAFREYFQSRGIHEQTLYTGIDAMLRTLNEDGRMLHLATTKPVVFAHQILTSYDIHHLFNQICGSDLSHPGRAKDEIVAEVLREGGIAPYDAVMVGDRRHDVAGAHRCGVPCIGVLFGYGGMEELSHAGADWIVKDVNELAAILATI